MCANTESKSICSSTISPPSLRFFGGTDQWLVRDDVIAKGKRRINARDQKVRFAGIVPIWCLVSIDNVWRVSHQFGVYWQLRHLVARLNICVFVNAYVAQYSAVMEEHWYSQLKQILVHKSEGKSLEQSARKALTLTLLDLNACQMTSRSFSLSSNVRLCILFFSSIKRHEIFFLVFTSLFFLQKGL